MGDVMRWVAIAAGFAAFVGSWREAGRLRVGPAEERIFRVVNDGPDVIHVPVWVVMQAGSLGAVWATGAGLWVGDERRAAVAAVVIGTAVWGGVKLVKPFIGRGRPSSHLEHVRLRGPAQSGLGFPSGHAAIALTLALIATEGAGPGVRLVAIAVAAAVGVARIYVGAHLPFDVAGGFAIGAILGALVGLAGWS